MGEVSLIASIIFCTASFRCFAVFVKLRGRFNDLRNFLAIRRGTDVSKRREFLFERSIVSPSYTCNDEIVNHKLRALYFSLYLNLAI